MTAFQKRRNMYSTKNKISETRFCLPVCTSLLQTVVEFIWNTGTSPATDRIRQIPTPLLSSERFQCYSVSLLLTFWLVTNLSELADGAGRDISFCFDRQSSIAVAVSVIRS